MSPSDPSPSELQKIESHIQASENILASGYLPVDQQVQMQATLATFRAQRDTSLARADPSSAIAQGIGTTALAEGATQVNTGGDKAVVGDIHAEQDVTLGDKILPPKLS